MVGPIDFKEDKAMGRLWELYYRKLKALKDRQIKKFGREIPVHNIHTPKTGGTSVCKGLEVRDTHDPLRWRKFKDPEWEKAKIIAGQIRDPYERALSWYLYGKPHNDFATFEDWVLGGLDPGWVWKNGTPRMLYQEDWIFYGGKLAINFVMRFETLERDFNRLCEKIGLDPIPEFPHVHKKTSDRHPYNDYDGYREDYTPFFNYKMREVLDPMFKDFCEAFGYPFGKHIGWKYR